MDAGRGSVPKRRGERRDQPRRRRTRPPADAPGPLPAKG
ncbi:hypothetical protein SHJG_4015 [Streptomyces hygroscopicus subsp. jinggangensis 5008]|nr:hypothetical protein SHJG_4015 [Streptomyces hygroscopicus subsp. jinggangensis 5008]AGF63445.1 hypothetical protein SHJGH_3780 [Streptomyces hygroscopicus subsp. jinggangensis TL01]